VAAVPLWRCTHGRITPNRHTKPVVFVSHILTDHHTGFQLSDLRAEQSESANMFANACDLNFSRNHSLPRICAIQPLLRHALPDLDPSLIWIFSLLQTRSRVSRILSRVIRFINVYIALPRRFAQVEPFPIPRKTTRSILRPFTR
jgi:hypothetical protein